MRKNLAGIYAKSRQKLTKIPPLFRQNVAIVSTKIDQKDERMDTTAKLHELMAADLDVHKQQAKIMRRGDRVMAAATIAFAIAVACSIAGGWWVIRHMQEQNAENLELIRQKVLMRI